MFIKPNTMDNILRITSPTLPNDNNSLNVYCKAIEELLKQMGVERHEVQYYLADQLIEKPCIEIYIY